MLNRPYERLFEVRVYQPEVKGILGHPARYRYINCWDVCDGRLSIVGAEGKFKFKNGICHKFAGMGVAIIYGEINRKRAGESDRFELAVHRQVGNSVLAQYSRQRPISSPKWQGSLMRQDEKGGIGQSSSIESVTVQGSSVVVQFEDVQPLGSFQYTPPTSEGDRT